MGRRDLSPAMGSEDGSPVHKRSRRSGAGRSARPSVAPGDSLPIAVGTIVRYQEGKGFGFILPDDESEDIFFLRSELPPQLTGQRQDVIQESKVEFEVQEMPDGKLRARKLVLLEPARGGHRGQQGPPDMARGGNLAVGRIIRFDKQKGFGFIESKDTQGDIFFMGRDCPPPLTDALNRGEDCRDFEVEVEVTMKEGKPRANRVMPLIRHQPPPPMPMPMGMPMAMPSMAGRSGGLPVEHGVIVNYDVKKAFGFIKPAQGGEDCFVMRAELPREIEGRSREDIINCHVEYEVKTMPDGKTRAQRCVLLPPQGAGGGVPGAVVGGGRRMFRGTIRQFNKQKGYGFIEVPGEPDVFLLPSELPAEFRDAGKLVGMEVAFEVHFTDDGKPRAKNVNVVQPGFGGGMLPPPPPFAGGLPPPPMGYGPPMMGMMGPPMMGMPGMPGPPPPMPPPMGAPRGGPPIRPGEVMQGRIARFYPEKGYGFLTPDEIEDDLFFLRSEMPQEIRDTQQHEEAVGLRVEFQVKIMPDGKMRAQRMTLVGEDDQGRTKKEKGQDKGEDVPLAPLDSALIDEMVEFLVEKGGGCDYGKFSSTFMKVKKQQLKEHFDICMSESGQRIELPMDHPARPEGDALGEEPDLEAPQEDGGNDDGPIDDDELSIPPSVGCTPVGRIKNYDPARGFGFITVLGKAEDIYFPRSALPVTFHGKKRSEMPDLDGVEVSFEEDTEQKGRTGVRASKINLLLKWHAGDDCYLLKRN